MRPGGGKEKGTTYERRIGKILGEFWDGKPLRRTPCSGGWDKFQTDGRTETVGDLYIPTGSKCPFAVECKHRVSGMNYGVHGVLQLQGFHSLYGWWVKLEDETRAWNTDCPPIRTLVPLLVFSGNRTGDCVMFRRSDVIPWLMTGGIKELEFFIWGTSDLWIMKLDRFLACLSKTRLVG